MNFPPEQIISLTTVIPHSSLTWRSAEDAILYLINHPTVRHQILAEVQRRSQGIMCNYLINHQIFVRPLFLHSHANNWQFLFKLRNLAALDANIWVHIPELEPDLRWAIIPASCTLSENLRSIL